MELPIFDLAAIINATDSFSNNKKLGEGGFGPVYKVNNNITRWKMFFFKKKKFQIKLTLSFSGYIARREKYSFEEAFKEF